VQGVVEVGVGLLVVAQPVHRCAQGPGCRPSSRNSRAAAGGEGVVGPGEHRPYLAEDVAGVQPAGPVAGRRQFGGDRGKPEGGLGGGPGGHEREREWQPDTGGDDLVGGLRFGGDPAVLESAFQHLVGFVVGEQVQGQGVGAVGGDQAGEGVAAGHDCQRRRAAG
jgi:hypothetical protein